MLTAKIMKEVQAETLAYWEKELQKQDMLDLAQGKEVGHKLADTVDEKTTALLTVNHFVAHQHNKKGEVRARSMGDLWLKEDKIYYPVNVKTGVSGSEGQPNLVSLKKILNAIMARQIDSYYLLFVKMSIDSAANTIAPTVYFVDMLDWLDYVTFDAGPGQMMLKAKQFYENYDTKAHKHLTLKQKLEKLMSLYRDGDRRLLRNRKLYLEQISDKFDTFIRADSFSVTVAAQKELNLR